MIHRRLDFSCDECSFSYAFFTNLTVVSVMAESIFLYSFDHKINLKLDSLIVSSTKKV